MEQELWELAASASTTLARAAGTDAWADVRVRLRELFARNGLIFIFPEWRGEGGVTAPHVEVRLRNLMKVDPGSAVELRAILAELAESAESAVGHGASSHGARSGSGVHNTLSGGTQGTVVQAGSIGSVTVQTPGYHQGTLVDPEDWPRAEDVDPLALGVRPARREPGFAPLPPYVARGCDDELVGAISRAGGRGGLVLLVGEPFTGKTRTALEAMGRFDARRVYAPARGADLRGLPALLQGRPERYFVWLDDLDGHLGDGGLEPRLLAQLATLHVIVLATMRDDAYDEHRHTPHGRVLDLAHTVELAREWSPAERERLAREAGRSGDRRLVGACASSGTEGAAAYLALGPLLREAWWRARRADRHPRGHALVRAALDLARCGLDGPLPMDLLLKVHEGYADVEGMDRESVEDARAWATERRDGRLRLLVRVTGDTWQVAPFLREAAERDEDLPPVDGQVWGCALEVARADEAYDYGEIAAGARAAFERTAATGDRHALHNLGVLAESLGEVAEAEEWFRRAAEAGEAQSAGRLGRMLAERGEGKAAEPYLEQAAGAGDVEAATLLGRLLRDRAERWLEVGAKGGSPEAAQLLGDLLAGRRKDDDALSWYLDADRVGYPPIAASMAAMALRWNERVSAEVWLRRAADAGDDWATGALKHYLSAESLDDAMLNFREEVEYGVVLGATNLGVLLETHGRVGEARDWYLKGQEQGDAYGAFRLAQLAEKQGETETSRAWYRKAAAMGHPGAERALAEERGPEQAAG
ncbi:tetratricopeptide repeat protein [Streptomyces sp. NPDC048506]|uniref:tetratricopeptide repeat protein n=1 Tax=Streptomyces sp. NPDC048506 TaxID=3155028 RepID=UPI003448A63B